jgi:hypothetical protein
MPDHKTDKTEPDIKATLKLIAGKAKEIEAKAKNGTDLRTLAVCLDLLTDVVGKQEDRLQKLEADAAAPFVR